MFENTPPSTSSVTKEWAPSLAFRRFQGKQYELNRLYWTQVISHEALGQILEMKDKATQTLNALNMDIPAMRHFHTVEETKQWAPEYLNRSRLHLLVICAANLESYLKEITFWHLYSNGYKSKNAKKLDAIGNAIGRPILSRSSLPEPLKYAQLLFHLDFGTNLTKWQRFYKLRCAAAHNGGMVTARTLKDIPDLTTPLHHPIGLSWKELKDALASAEHIAKAIDQKATDKRLRLNEVKHELNELKSIGNLPEKERLWEFIHQNYGLKGLKRREKATIEAELY